MLTVMAMDLGSDVIDITVGRPASDAVVFLVQSRLGNMEFALSPERLTRDGVVFVCDQPLGMPQERLLIDICLGGGESADAIDIVAAVVGHIDGVGTQVRFCWSESNPKSHSRLALLIEERSVLKPGSDYPITSFALAA